MLESLLDDVRWHAGLQEQRRARDLPSRRGRHGELAQDGAIYGRSVFSWRSSGCC